MAGRRRTAKDLKLPGACHVRRNLRSFDVLRRHFEPREEIEQRWRLRQSQDGTTNAIRIRAQKL
jgi:hypothetical protein